MSRYARQHSASNVYHIMIRGNERKDIFLDEEDKRRFIDTLDRMKGQKGFTIYSYCLMNNHVHLLIREGEEAIQKSMKRIGVSYTYYFNKKYQRVGHLFQDRFRSEPAEMDSYLLAASRYIHNNPVKAGLVHKAEDYRWSSYCAYICAGLSGKQSLIDCDFLLSMLSDETERAIAMFKEYTSNYAEDRFIDLNSEGEINKEKKDVNQDTILRIANILKNYNLVLESLRNCRNKELRNNVLREIKENLGISIRDLSRMTGISKDTIFRA